MGKDEGLGCVMWFGKIVYAKGMEGKVVDCGPGMSVPSPKVSSWYGSGFDALQP